MVLNETVRPLALAASVTLMVTGCAVAKPRVDYPLDNVARAPRAFDSVLAVAELVDVRREVLENRLVFDAGRIAEADGRLYCTNSEQEYDPGVPVIRAVSLKIREHLARRGAFRDVVDAPTAADFVLTGSLRQLYGVQERSTSGDAARSAGAMFGALGGAIGAIVASNVKSSGLVRIELTDLVLRDRAGAPIARLAPVSRSFEGALPADSTCRRIFDGVNEQLREAVGTLALEVEASLPPP